MNYTIVSLRILVFIIVLAPFRVTPASAAPQSPTISATGYLSIPTVAFLPLSQDYTYESTSRILKAEDSQARFRAPVILPNGSYIHNMKACFYDDSPTTSGTVKMYNALLDDAGTVTEMAGVTSVTDSDYLNYTDNTVSPVANNNLAFTYWLELTLPASSGAGHDVYFCGAYIEYLRSTTALPSISLPGAAFDRPFEDGYNAAHTQVDGRLVHFHTPAGDVPGTYLAPVNLPDGATVTRLTAYYQDDNAAQTINVFLERTILGSNTDMASAASADTGYKTDDTTIANPIIDNYNYSYWLYTYLPSTNLSLWAVTIEYTPPAIEEDWLAIPSAAFTPHVDGLDYQNHGRWLGHQHSPGGGTEDGVYSAPLMLPQGARIDGLWATFYDGSTTVNGDAYLGRADTGLSTSMAEAHGSGSGGYTTSIDSSISYSIVDNSRYTYSVQFVLPVSSGVFPPGTPDVVGVRIIIQYTRFYPVFLPLVRK